jgi:hypothetical protein
MIRLGAPLVIAVATFLIMSRLIRLTEPWQLLAGRRSFEVSET